MAILYPGAAYHQLPGKSTTLLGPRIINVHTMVWNLEDCEDYFAQAGNPYSHFGTGPNGQVHQWQDLTYRAASDLDGNPFCISIENADKGPGYPSWSGSDVPRMTAAQAEAVAQLIAWLCTRFAIPPYDVSDSLPDSVGPGYHRHGINPWRVPGGVLYSKSYGKVCPGDRRIAQFHEEIMPRVRSLLQKDWFDMATKEDLAAVLEEHDRNRQVVTNIPGGGTLSPALAWTYAHESGYWGLVNGQTKPVICATDDNPTLWYAVWPFHKAGPFTATEAEEAVNAEQACYHRSTSPSWRAFMIPQWLMDACELVYEHLPASGVRVDG